jgi:hypothetical protein
MNASKTYKKGCWRIPLAHVGPISFQEAYQPLVLFGIAQKLKLLPLLRHSKGPLSAKKFWTNWN